MPRIRGIRRYHSHLAGVGVAAIGAVGAVEDGVAAGMEIGTGMAAVVGMVAGTAADTAEKRMGRGRMRRSIPMDFRIKALRGLRQGCQSLHGCRKHVIEVCTD